jgi:predicted secreted hydrolase
MRRRPVVLWFFGACASSAAWSARAAAVTGADPVGPQAGGSAASGAPASTSGRTAARPASPTADTAPPVRLPADFGSHPQARTEWWYATGSLEAGGTLRGFQVTFFRAATGIAASQPSRFAAHELVLAHAAVTDLGARKLRHDQRIARSGFGIAEARVDDTDVTLRDWRFTRDGAADASRYRAHVTSDAAGFTLDLELAATQPPMLQGLEGISRKGPGPGSFSHYYSEPQLAVQGTLRLDGAAHAVRGRAWLDHEWSDAYLEPEAAGWDWIGMNLDDGSALMAFRMRRRDGNMLWAGGSWRPRDGAVRDFGPHEVLFTPRRTWQSPASNARYPVEWDVLTPLGRHMVRAVLDDQELDSRASTGAIYWEGLSDLLDARGSRVGRGYLEMTGYAAPLTL